MAMDALGGGDRADLRDIGRGGGDGEAGEAALSESEATLRLDSNEGGLQLPKIASRNADAVGEGIEYSETDSDGRSPDTDIESREGGWSASISVSIGVAKDMSSSES